MAGRKQMKTLRKRVLELDPDLDQPETPIRDGDVLVDGSVVTNPASMVPPASSVAFRIDKPLRGRLKLDTALSRWPIPLAGAVAIDAGAAAGGFTQALLHAGVRKVYAVDVGYGQLVGSLRQDPRVVNLERVNIAALDRGLVPEPVDVLALDLGYLALSDGVAQLDRLELSPAAEMIALVKPMFELRLGSPPSDRATLDEALSRARDGIAAAGWDVIDSIDCPVRGSRGARELFIRARRRTTAAAQLATGEDA